MLNYIIRRLLYFIPILIGVNILVFMLFFYTNSPDDIAEKVLGRNVTPDAIDTYKRNNNLDLPKYWNKGWQRIGTLSAKEKENSKVFEIGEDGPSEFLITVEAPNNYSAYLDAAVRTVTVTSGDETKTWKLEPVKIDSESKKVKTPKRELKKVYTFEVAGKAAKKIKIDFALSATGLRHRITLDGKDDLSFAESITKTLLWQFSLRKLWFDFGRSMRDKPIGKDIRSRILPSLCITVPSMIMGLIFTLFFSMILAYLRGTRIDFYGVIYCILLMSISGMFYIIGGQYVLGKALSLFPISGYDYGISTLKFVMIPIIIALVGGLGGGIRFYRTIFLEEINKDYVRTAKAKGLNERSTLFVHVLKNAMIPILTQVVVGLPFLIMGGLVTESFFAIPGLGGYMLEGIQAQDFFVVQSMVSLSSFLFVVALLLTDISYTLVDPRVRLE